MKDWNLEDRTRLIKERDEAREVSVRLVRLSKVLIEKCNEVWDNPDVPAETKLYFKAIKWDIQTVLKSKVDIERPPQSKGGDE